MLCARHIMLIIALLVFNGCVHRFKSQCNLKVKLEADAVQVLFDYLIEDYDKWKVGGEKVVFIGYGWKNWDGNISPMTHHFAPAPDDWVRRLSIPGIETKNVTECVGKDNDSFVIDRITGNLGFIFQVENIEWLSQDEIHVKIWLYSGFMQASGKTIILLLKNGKWGVVGYKDEFLQ